MTVDATEGFRNRLTISALWGWDNQFSGNMIQAATGQTTTGVPINMNETTYDDVYGRMGIFKIGAGYRTTPRTEAVFNFVYSKSAAETVNVGTAGAGNVPLYVNFDDYSYWGIEGGQRFFFTRVRFTPYVGYLVGLNRYGDIRGTFVDVPAEATPGLAAQDGKFFEKSWAFSLGPHRRRAHRPWPHRVDVRDAAALHGRAVGRRLARRGGPARHQQRELALVVSGSARRQDSVLIAQWISSIESRGVARPAAMLRLVSTRLSRRLRLSAHRQSEQIDIRRPGNGAIGLTAMNVRSGELKWRLACLLINGATKSQSRYPKPRVVAGFQSCPPSPSGIITTMTPIAGSVNRPTSNTPTCIPTMPYAGVAGYRACIHKPVT